MEKSYLSPGLIERVIIFRTFECDDSESILNSLKDSFFNVVKVRIPRKPDFRTEESRWDFSRWRKINYPVNTSVTGHGLIEFSTQEEARSCYEFLRKNGVGVSGGQDFFYVLDFKFWNLTSKVEPFEWELLFGSRFMNWVCESP